MQIRPWTLPSSPDIYLPRQVSWLRFIAALSLPSFPVAFLRGFPLQWRVRAGLSPDFPILPKRGTLKAHISSFTTIINLAKVTCQVLYSGAKNPSHRAKTVAETGSHSKPESPKSSKLRKLFFSKKAFNFFVIFPFQVKHFISEVA